MWTQIVGKTRLTLAPMENHWWQVALYVTPRGLTTSPMAHGDRTFAVDFDFIEHALWVRAQDGVTRRVALAPRSVADFYASTWRCALDRGGRQDLARSRSNCRGRSPSPNATHAPTTAMPRPALWRILLQTDRVFQRVPRRFLGKGSPVHFLWGSFDLAATRFSARPAPPHGGGVRTLRTT